MVVRMQWDHMGKAAGVEAAALMEPVRWDLLWGRSSVHVSPARLPPRPAHLFKVSL